MNKKKHISQIKTENKNQKMIKEYLELLTSLKRTEGTRKNVDFVLNKLARFLGNTDFKKATKKQMQDFFKTIKSYSTYNIYGAIIIRFLAWNLDLDKKQRPTNMRWFEYISEERMEKESDPEDIKKHLITPEEYKIIVGASRDKYGLYEALWETYYLSGGRLEEVQLMKIGDVRIEGTNVSIVLTQSKTKPRVVPHSIHAHTHY
jgi:integrase